jgi:hypothetical protein
MDKNKKNQEIAKMLLVRIHPDSCEEALKDMLDGTKTKQIKVERGLYFNMEMGKEFFKKIEIMLKRGYFFCGIVVENGNRAEMLFQRHPKQTEKHKLPEAKRPEELKYKV